MQKKIKRFLALMMSLIMLAALLPTAAFTESDMIGYPEVEMEQATDGENPLIDPAEDTLHPETNGEAVPDGSEAEEPWIDSAKDAMAPETAGDEQIDPVAQSLESVIAANGYAYVMTEHAATVYGTADMAEPIFIITQEIAVLLATEYLPQDGQNSVRVWFITEENEVLTGYIVATEVTDTILGDEDVNAMADILWSGLISSDAGERYAFVVAGEKPGTDNEEPAADDSEPIQETEDYNDPTATEEPTLESLSVSVGDYVAVTPQTRAFLGIDETASDEYIGDLSLGVFVNNATVQVASIEQDNLARYWFKVRFLYGDDYADGTMKWTDEGFLYVLASETADTMEQECSVTDYAFSVAPSPFMGIMALATPMNGFSLKSISGSIPSLSVGQTGLYGSSGKDSDYKQIATAPGQGTVYATPHYLNGFTVYCLEHNLPGPGENISGGGQQPTGPYVIVDIDSYRNTPGYSSIIYNDKTLHAIAWVLRHTYPFMVLDRNDADNVTWSRVAGQFAIRQVIRQMEGAQYVRSYWNMDNFYVGSGQAPSVYLAYARWLAENGIARGQITGYISITGKTVNYSGGTYTGTATLTTDADLMRIRKTVGSMTGYTGGSDSTYYYLNSGDTITVSSASNPFTITAESINSDSEEASFLVGVPSASIQKVLIPQYGAPYKMQSASITFEIPYGSISVTKRAATSGAVLPGAVFELLNSSGTVVQTLTTNSSGIVKFNDLQPGSYSVREKTAPEGYYIASSNSQNVTVTAGNTSTATFTNNIITSKVRIVKKDQLTKEPLPGAEFTITRLSAPASHNGAGVGDIVAVITTDANGIAETGWLEWGKYKVEETKVPLHFVDNHYSTVIDAYENGKTYVIEVENEPAKGWIQITKTDRQNGNPIEGVRFDIYYNDQYGTGYAGSMVTDKNGVAISEPLRKGKYIVKEHGETAGYVFETITLDATVRSDETTKLVATNRHVTIRLKLYKRDVEEYDGENPNSTANPTPKTTLPDPADISPPATRGDGILTGAEFQVRAGENIKDRQGNVVYAKGAVVVESLKTAGEDISVPTGELWPGLYEIIELTPPVGYQPSNTPIYVDARSAALQSQVAIVTYEGLKTNKIHYGALAIVKFLGDNLQHTGSGIVEIPEEDAEFEVYLKSAGSYENARDVERDYLTTNRYGRAKTKALPYGVYVLRQVVGKEGHAMMLPIDFMIDGTEDLNDPPSFILNNQARYYRLRIIKIDSETGNTITLAGTAFRLKDADGNIVKQSINYPVPKELNTFLTDENGEVTLPEAVAWGQYFIEEVQSPDGYLINSEPMGVFIGHTGDAADEVHEIAVEFPNDPVKGNIVVDKMGFQLTGFEAMTDDYGNEYQQPIYQEQYLEGVTFELFAAEDIVGKEGTVWYKQGDQADTIITTASGSDQSKELPLGKYYLVETIAPIGYVFENVQHEANLVFADNLTAKVVTTVEIGNEYLPAELSMEKEKEITQVQNHEGGTVRQIIVNTPGEGFVFGLYIDEDIHYSSGTLMADALVATGATDANGVLTISGYYPHGQYYFKELSAPKGWKLNPARFGVSLDPALKAEEANVIRVSLPGIVHDELIYTLITLTKTDITGENTVPGAVIEVRNSEDEVIYRATTDEDGHIPDIPVVPGIYTFHEVLAPEGYASNEAVLSFTVDESGNVTGDTTIRDDYTRISLKKQDGDGQPLTGVEFALLAEDGSPMFTAFSDENGLVTFERIPYGNYNIVETKPLPGYLKNDTKIPLSVDGYFINPSAPVATLVNQHMSLDGFKVDTSGNPIPGTEFSLINVETGQVMESVLSDDQGGFALTKFDYGEWIIRETAVPEGYSQMNDMLLRVDESWTQPASFTFVNIPNHYEFVKVDHEGNPLPGVRFTLEDEYGNVLREMESGDDGIVHVTDLNPGVYIISEIETLEGFVRTDETIQVVIDENYVVPEEMYQLINYPGIQTGVEFTITPVMWGGIAMVLAGAALIVVHGVKSKKIKRRRWCR